MSIGILLSDDLIFTSRITGTGKALGLDINSTSDIESLIQMAQAEQVTGALLDLDFPGLNIKELMDKINGCCKVMGYGSHVKVENLKSAREAGCDPVLPRSAFVEKLPSDLPAWIDSQ